MLIVSRQCTWRRQEIFFRNSSDSTYQGSRTCQIPILSSGTWSSFLFLGQRNREMNIWTVMDSTEWNGTNTRPFSNLTSLTRWCLCASRWDEARRAGKAPDVVLESTHASTLKHGVTLPNLKNHATGTSGDTVSRPKAIPDDSCPGGPGGSEVCKPWMVVI